LPHVEAVLFGKDGVADGLPLEGSCEHGDAGGVGP
jgi:hypothetical protein